MVDRQLPENGSNRWRTLAFRDAVLVELHEAGLTGARRQAIDEPDARRRAMRDNGVIEGLPFTLTCHRRVGMDLSTTIDAAEAHAHATGSDRWAVVHHRKGQGVADAYVVMPFCVFTKVLRDVGATDSSVGRVNVRPLPQ